MSKQSEMQFNCIKDFSVQLRSVQGTDVCLSDTNKPIWSDAFLMWTALITDTCYQSDWCRLEKTDDLLHLFSEGTKTIRIMKELLLRLRPFRADHKIRYRNFKRSVLHDLEGSEALLNVVEPILQKFVLTPVGSTFRPLNDVLSFFSHLTLDNPALDDEAIVKFRAADDIVITAEESLIARMETVIKGWLEGFEPDLSYGYHGPGASAGLSRRASSPDAKFSRLRGTSLLKYAGCALDDIPLGPDEPSEIVFVPKSPDSRRTICKVPAWKMFWQKPVQEQLYSFIEHSPLRKHVCFSRQDYSRRMCQIGSQFDTYYTIDLSSASDTVAWDLVKRTFHRTSIFRIMYATRSRLYRLPDGTQLVPKKFDPMGSALTFPIESLIFAAVCESCAIARNPRYRVYGDDIVCHPADIPAEVLIPALTSLGFKVNVTKSYLKGPFREACGMECYLGEDVSPVRIGRKWHGLRPQSPDDVAGLRSLANELSWRGYKQIRLLIVRACMTSRFGRGMYFHETGEADSWQSFSASNYRLATRWNIEFQRTERLAILSSQKRENGIPANQLYTWYAARYRESVVIPRLTGDEWQPPLIMSGSSGTGSLKAKTRIGWLPFLD